MQTQTEFVPNDYHVDNHIGRPWPRQIYIEREGGKEEHFSFVTIQEFADKIRRAHELIGPRDARIIISDSHVLKGPERAYFEIERGWSLDASLSIDWGNFLRSKDREVVGRLYPDKEDGRGLDYTRYEVVKLITLSPTINLSTGSCGGDARTMLLKANVIRDLAEFGLYIEQMIGECKNIVKLEVIEPMQERKD